MEVSFDDFKRLDIRIGKVVDVQVPEGSKSVIKLTVDFGNEKMVAMSGIKNHYTAGELVGKKFVFITNLERKRILGVESECMILAADDERGNVVLLQPVKDIDVGTRIR